MASECKTCKVAINPYNKSGYCRICWNTSPEKRAKLSAATKRNWAEKPELRQKYVEAGKRNLTLPGVREKAIQSVKERRAWEIASKAITKEARMKGGRRGSATKLAHIPRELHDEYRLLTRTKKYLAAEATDMLLEQHERDMEKFRRSISEVVYDNT